MITLPKEVSENLSESICDYLSSTRFLLPQENSVSDVLYESQFQYIHDLSELDDINISMVSVYTDSLKSEAISDGDTSVIVHDQYLGQVLNMLNRLFLYDASMVTKAVYVHKVISHIFSRYGFYPESVFAARKYLDNREDVTEEVQRKQGESVVHAEYTHIQELFILLHEYSHIVFRTCPEKYDYISRDVIEWVDSYGKSTFNEDLIDKVINDPSVPEEERLYYINNKEKLIQDNKVHQRYVTEVSQRDDLLEEFMCDRLALVNIIPYFMRLKSTSSVKGRVRAIVLCFLHLRSIMNSEIRCSLEENTDFAGRIYSEAEAESLFITYSNMRLHHIKNFCLKFHLNTPDERNEMNLEMRDLMNQHTDEIGNHFYNFIEKILYEKDLQGEIQRVFDRVVDLSQFEHRVTTGILTFAGMRK